MEAVTGAGHQLSRRGQVLRFSLHGLWGEAERAAWESDLTRHLAELTPGFQFLVDLTDYPAQDEQTQALHQRCMGLSLQRGLGRAVHVVPSQVMRSQMKRTSDATPDAARFVYVADLAAAEREVHRYAADATNSTTEPTSTSTHDALSSLLPGAATASAPSGSGPAGRPRGGVPPLTWAAVAMAGAACGAALVEGSPVGAAAASVAGVLSLVAGVRSQRAASSGRAVGDASGSMPGSMPVEPGSAQVLARAAALVAEQAHGLRDSGALMAGVVQEVSSVAREVQDQAGEIAERLAHVAGDTRRVAGSITEISQQTSMARGLTGDAAARAGATRDGVRTLDESSREIGNVVLMIRQIAEQTNMLALNATIEAARAGSAGKGFAVVASEVKELAKATAVATGQIESRVGSIQAEVLGTVSAIDSITGVVEEVSTAQDAVSLALSTQQQVTVGIEQAVGLTTEGAAGLVEQIRRLVLATSEVGATAGAVAASATTLDEVRAELERLAHA